MLSQTAFKRRSAAAHSTHLLTEQRSVFSTHSSESYFTEKFTNAIAYYFTVFFQSKVSCVEQMKLQIFDVSLVRLGSRCWENLIIFTPDY